MSVKGLWLFEKFTSRSCKTLCIEFKPVYICFLYNKNSHVKCTLNLLILFYFGLLQFNTSWSVKYIYYLVYLVSFKI